MTDEKTEADGLTRLSFIKSSAGLAAGVAAIGVPVGIASPVEAKGVEVEPSSPSPSEPVVAYVRDAKRGEVTVMSGTGEATYRDPALARRLLAAAPQDPIANGGGGDVVTP